MTEFWLVVGALTVPATIPLVLAGWLTAPLAVDVTDAGGDQQGRGV